MKQATPANIVPVMNLWGKRWIVEWVEGPAIATAVSNLSASSATIRRLLDGVQAGKGLAGKLLENEEIAANVSQIAYNLSITTSNLNRLGLWRMLWQHQPPQAKGSAPPHPVLASPKNPFAE